MTAGDRYALVTGASSGIGAVYADRLAARGKNLVLAARRRDRLEALADRLAATHGVKVECVETDLSDAVALGELQALLREREDVDFLVNNAGLWTPGPSASVDAAAVEQIVKVNILALTMLSLAVTPRFRRKKEGTIVNIGSLISFKSSPTAAVYCASKAYVLNFTCSLQAEFAGSAVKVQLVVPGFVRTEIFGDRALSLSDNVFSSAEDIVDCALQGLDRGELVCLPTLEDPELWTEFEAARKAITDATQTGQTASRYQSMA
jgi:short-subunit dehydrogenase